MLPINQQAEEPEAYRLFLAMQETGLPLVPGGVLDQPYALSREIAAVRGAIAQFAIDEKAREARIRELDGTGK